MTKSALWRILSKLFDRILSSYDSDEEENDGCDEENVDEPSDGIYSYDAEDPENKKDNCNCD